MSAKVLMNGRVLTTLVMLIIFIIFAVIALDFPAKGRLMPLMISIPAIVLGLVQLVIEYRAVLSEVTVNQAATEKPENADKKGENQMIIWTTVFFIGILLFGFIYASPVLVFGFLYFGSKESIKVSLISAVATWTVMYFTFVEWFQMSLFQGFIPEWLLG